MVRDLESRDAVVEAFVEIPLGSQNKYELDKERNVIRLDRVLHSPVHYPTDYGFIPETLAEDGDPLDILIMISAPTFPGCLVEARPVGALYMEDEMGIDVKILAAAVGDPRYAEVWTLEDLPAHRRREIEYFFDIYKELEGKETMVEGWHDRAYALAAIREARERYRGSGG